MKDEIKDIRKTYSDMVQGNSASGADTVANSLNIPNRTIKVEVSEVMEREKRKNNLVILGIEETNDEFATKEKLKNIINALGADENKIKYYGRVGRVGQGTKARIVRVTCEDAETKRNFLKSANKLKTMEGFANVYVALDLTKVQQTQDKNLREKLKDIRLTHKDAKINNREIVIFDNGNRKVLSALQQ